MAASAKLLGRISSALHGGKAASESGCAMRRLMAQASEIPEGYALTSSGILVPWSNPVALKGFDLRVRQLEGILVEKMETGSSLFYRLTKSIVSTAACGFALKLTWYEITDNGHIQHYLPGAPQAPALGYVSKKCIVDEVNAKMVLKFNAGWQESSLLGVPVPFLLAELVLAEQKKILEKRGFCDQDIGEAQIVLADLLVASTAEHKLAPNGQQSKVAVAEPKTAAPEGSKTAVPEGSKTAVSEESIPAPP